MSQYSDSFEVECPLQQQPHYRKNASSLKGPLRVLRLCLLSIILPCLLIAGPLYLRYNVYADQLYPLAMSDMRLLDNRVSTTWCQRQLVSSNATFNAFLLPKQPTVAEKQTPLSMVRHLVLEDDMKEYWGFYLLRGSSVTVSTCVRWPGASLIVIRGHKHLHECAYIGDDSSEELEELMEALKEGTYVPDSSSAPSNNPEFMKRHRQDVEFHDPSQKNETHYSALENGVDSSDVTDPKVLKQILESLSKKTVNRPYRNKTKTAVTSNYNDHVRRTSTIDNNERQNIEIEKPAFNTTSQELFEDLLHKLQNMGDRGKSVLEKLSDRLKHSEASKTEEQNTAATMGRQYEKPKVQYDDNIDIARRRKRDLILSTAFANKLNEHDESNDAAIEEGLVPDGIADHRGFINETTPNDMSNSEFWSSFSSSEEALLNCAGLILNLPLTPHHRCERHLSDRQIEDASLTNTITYKVPTNGYYFFVFNSENEVQQNYIRVQFHLKKSVYDVSDAVSACSNYSGPCAFNLQFFSNEKLVLELPVRDNDTLWNEEFVVVSECEPRTSIYMVCVISVPLIILMFAFQ